METTDKNLLILLIYKSTMENIIMEYLEDTEIRHYTRWHQVQGRGSNSDPHFDDHVWPGTNNVLAIAGTMKEKEIVFRIVSVVKQKLPGEGIKAISLPIEDLT